MTQLNTIAEIIQHIKNNTRIGTVVLVAGVDPDPAELTSTVTFSSPFNGVSDPSSEISITLTPNQNVKCYLGNYTASSFDVTASSNNGNDPGHGGSAPGDITIYYQAWRN